MSERKVMDVAGFDAWAAEYEPSVKANEQRNEYPCAGYTKLMHEMQRAIFKQKGKHVLDIGVGTGIMSVPLYERGHSVTGLDFSHEMLRFARARMPEATFILHDFRRGLPDFTGQVFDVIVMAYFIHHFAFETQYALLRSLLPHLRSAGVILIGDVAFADRAKLQAARERYEDIWDGAEYYPVWQDDRLAFKDLSLSFATISHCAGIITIRR